MLDSLQLWSRKTWLPMNYLIFIWLSLNLIRILLGCLDSYLFFFSNSGLLPCASRGLCKHIASCTQINVLISWLLLSCLLFFQIVVFFLVHRGAFASILLAALKSMCSFHDYQHYYHSLSSSLVTLDYNKFFFTREFRVCETYEGGGVHHSIFLPGTGDFTCLYLQKKVNALLMPKGGGGGGGVSGGFKWLVHYNQSSCVCEMRPHPAHY